MEKFYSLSLVALVVLSGCGGGGSGGSGGASGAAPTTSAPPTTPVVVPPPVQPVPPVTQPVTQPVTAIQAESLQLAVAPSYPANSEEAAAFGLLNTFRTSMGLGPVRQDKNIDTAANNHNNYVMVNQSGADAHVEIQGKPGFTGVTAGDREVAAGYAATGWTEVIAFNTMYPTTDYNAVTVLADTVYHRVGMMRQTLTHVGISPSSANSPTIFDLGNIVPQLNAGNYVGVYPYNGQTGLSLTHYVESPNPFLGELEMTSDNMCTKTSYPISLAAEHSTVLTVDSFTVTEDGQSAALDVRLMTNGSSEQNRSYIPQNVAFIVGKAPFKKNTKYNVHFVGKATGAVTGTANGMPIDKTWSFTTGIDLRCN